jgi:putative hydrolase of the HAD superfamily
MIKAVLFDLDRTLLDRDTSFRNFVVSQYERFASDLGPISQEKYVERVVALDNRGLRWKDKVYQGIVQEFDLKTLAWETLFTDFEQRIADYYLPFPQMREMLEALKTKSYKLGLITNGKGPFQMRTIQTIGIENDFAAILISEIEGLRKPEPEIFHRALARLDCQPKESVFVGDSIEADVRGAKNAGLWTIWKSEPGIPAPAEANAILHHLDELPSLIEGLITRIPS